LDILDTWLPDEARYMYPLRGKTNRTSRDCIATHYYPINNGIPISLMCMTNFRQHADDVFTVSSGNPGKIKVIL